jgi:hypothetical protein
VLACRNPAVNCGAARKDSSARAGSSGVTPRGTSRLRILGFQIFDAALSLVVTLEITSGPPASNREILGLPRPNAEIPNQTLQFEHQNTEVEKSNP